MKLINLLRTGKEFLLISSLVPEKSARAFSKSCVLSRYFEDVKLKESYCHSSSRQPLIGKTIGQALDEAAEMYPDKEAFIYGIYGDRQTYKQLKEEVNSFAAGLLAIGIEKGDRVGIWGPNTREWVVTQFATARIGAILVNVNPAYRTMELEYALKKVGMKAIVSAHSFKTQDYYGMLRELCPELDDCIPGKLQSERLPEMRSIIMMGDTKIKGTFLYDEVMGISSEQHIHQAEDISKTLQYDDPVNIQFTSGTTGYPKATTLTHHGLVNNARFFGYILECHKEDSVMCLPIPLYHCAGTVGGSLATVVHATTCVLPSPSFEPDTSLESIQNERCTSIVGTPTIYISMVNHPDFDKYDTSSLRLACIGGAACPIDILNRLKNRGVLPLPGFGMTECSFGVSVVFPDYDIESNSVGRPLDHTEVKIVDVQNKKILPVDQTGELCVRGYNVMKEYWEDSEKTREAIDGDGWFHTGDLASMSDDGSLTIRGRLKDMVIRGGTNIFPAEIENFLHEHEKIENVQIVGVPDNVMGEELCACIKLKEGQTATSEEIKEFCKGKITHYKIPRYVEFVDSFPMTVTLKVQKVRLQEIMTTKLGL